MAEGRIRKYLEEICLVSQSFVKDSSMTVDKYLKSKGASMIGFSRIAVGEGIEKKQDDFAGKLVLPVLLFMVSWIEKRRRIAWVWDLTHLSNRNFLIFSSFPTQFQLR